MGATMGVSVGVTGETKRLRVVAVVDYYFPARAGGGVPQAVRQVIGDPRVSGVIVTTDHDLGDRTPHPDDSRLATDAGAAVDYVPAATKRPWRRVIGYEPDVVLLTSPFSRRTIRVLLARRWAILRSRWSPRSLPVVVLWSHGEMSPRALAEKPLRKRVFLVGGRLLGLFAGVSWCVVDPRESDAVKRLVALTPEHFGCGVPSIDQRLPRPAKQPGELRLVFVGRVVELKGVHLVLEALRGVRGRVRFTIIGPEADPDYAERCRALIRDLPATVDATLAGPLDQHRIAEEFAGHHASILATSYESFGYAIYESLAQGCVAVVSRATLFDFTESDGGMYVDLTPESIRSALQDLIDEDDDALRRRSRAARAVADDIHTADDRASALVTRLAELVPESTGSTAGSSW